MGLIVPAFSQDWGIDRASLGPVMSAALIGMVFGSLGSGLATVAVIVKGMVSHADAT